jgi:hypothetical protein
MPETTTQKRQRKLHEAVVAARARREDPREDAAVEKIVAPKPEPTSAPAATTPKPAEPTKVETTANSERIKAREHSTTPPGSNFAKTWGKSLGPKPQAKVYQKHVLFAVVSAFLIQIIALGKSLSTTPGKGL